MSSSRGLNNSRAHQIQRQDEEEDVVILTQVDKSALIAQFNCSLVGRMFNKEDRSIKALIALLPIANIWDVEGRVHDVDLGNSRFQFDFYSETDLQKILNKRPCHFNRWSFALERWSPHVGDVFPNSMTFWVRTTGIPTHFWMDEIFSEFGKTIGVFGAIEAKAARFQVTIKVDEHLKFEKRARLSTGEIVTVFLKYESCTDGASHASTFLMRKVLAHCLLISREKKKEKKERLLETLMSR
ncbi:uncharacterized protein LOC112089188 [Eutrema salsugineum]|uniref:uncharacterized protein LOC112089188 n=1 Tax=Eutrema salsugineum TaxID=72664 RepID=UPI000CED5E6C|nr:uncharacterized protein LOC112089188 [Eutrema salsugineum]